MMALKKEAPIVMKGEAKKSVVKKKKKMTSTGLRKLALELGASEQSKRVHKNHFEPTKALRERRVDLFGRQSEAVRNSLYRRCWRWAARRLILERWHYEQVVWQAVQEGLFTTTKRGDPKSVLSKVHRRIGWSYFDDKEYALAREHFQKLIDLGVRREIASPDLWRRLARCDVELFKETVGQEQRLAVALESYKKCLERTEITVTVVAKIPGLLVELAEVYERYGAYSGALYFLNMVLEYFPRGSTAFEEAAYRATHCLFHLATFPANEDPKKFYATATELMDSLRETAADVFDDKRRGTIIVKKKHGKYHNHELATLLYARICECRAADDKKQAGDWLSRAKRSYLELYTKRRSRRAAEALAVPKTGSSGARIWLKSRTTWFTLAREAEAQFEPTLALDIYTQGVRRSSKRKQQFEEEGYYKREEVEDDDVGMLLSAARLHERFGDQRSASQCAHRALQFDWWDSRGRAYVLRYNEQLRDRFALEERCAVLLKKCWHARVWRSPYLLLARNEIVERAEEALSKDYYFKKARRDLAYFATETWRPIFLYEESCAVKIQQFGKQYVRAMRFHALMLSRHIRKLGTAHGAWAKKATTNINTREALVRLLKNPLTPQDHRAVISAWPIIKEQDGAATAIQRIARGGQARVVPEEAVVEVEEVVEVDFGRLLRYVRAVNTIIGLRLRVLHRRRRAAQKAQLFTSNNYHAARRVVKCFRRFVREKQEKRVVVVHLAAHFDPRLNAVVTLQGCHRQRMTKKKRMATLLQSLWRSKKARQPLREMRSRRKAAHGISRAYHRRLNKQRGLLSLLRKRKQGFFRHSRPAEEAITRARRRVAMSGLSDWCAPGFAGSAAFQACAARVALLAEGEALSGVAVPLFTLNVGHWSSSLRLLCVVGANLSDEQLNTSALCSSLGSCAHLEELALVNCNLGSKNAASLIESISSRALDLSSLIVDCGHDKKHSLAARTARCVGDYVFVQFSRLRTLSLCRASVDDDEAASFATALGNLSTLVQVDLEDNCIGDAGALALGLAIAHSKRLRRLSLSMNRVQDRGANGLLLGVRDRQQRTGENFYLDLSSNFITDKIVIPPLLKGSTLLLDGNPIIQELLKIPPQIELPSQPQQDFFLPNWADIIATTQRKKQQHLPLLAQDNATSSPKKKHQDLLDAALNYTPLKLPLVGSPSKKAHSSSSSSMLMLQQIGGSPHRRRGRRR